MSDFSIPSKRHDFSALCKQCEAEVDTAAKAAAEVAAQTIEPVETQPVSVGIHDVDVKPRGNFSTLGELRDIPEHFPKVVELFRRTLDSCYNGIDINLRQYKPSMVSDEHTAILRAMIEQSYKETLEVFDEFMTRTYANRTIQKNEEE